MLWIFILALSGLAAASACGSSWTFLFTFLHCRGTHMLWIFIRLALQRHTYVVDIY